MPTAHVTPDDDGPLQEIANLLYKSKKVVVVTGAGISTNSGIPDFRSENGLYSLIQAQFDAAAKCDTSSDRPDGHRSSSASNSGDEPARKRRKLSVDDGSRQLEDQSVAVPSSPPLIKDAAREGQQIQVGQAEHEQSQSGISPSRLGGELMASRGPLARRKSQSPTRGSFMAPISIRRSASSPPDAEPRDPRGSFDPTSQSPFKISTPLPQPISNPPPPAKMPPESLSGLGLPGPLSTEPLQISATPNSSQSGQPTVPFSSSPLSSPPPILFDPYEVYRSGSTTSGRSSASSTSSSECGETPPSSQRALSLSRQSSRSGRHSLPNLKGRDLFDAAIWSDPLSTSVFYTFTTSLRQKVKNVSPTTSHHFISHLRDAGKLVRCYTQNIDEIEEKVGLTTSLGLGPGSRGRFSTRSGSRHSTGTMPPGANADGDGHGALPQHDRIPPRPPARDPADRGVECVFLHGSLNALRCFMCGHTSNWDEAGRENETMSGRQPSCPRCEGATAAREERGKRKLGVGKLRPDIVLYGEEHPNAHLISPIIQHDLSLSPDVMLILGTSLKVHGLKVMVKEFAKAIHKKGGKVVFVNFTKPPESVWSEVIDYWVQWDCDAWVDDLKAKKPILWLPPGAAKAASENNEKSEKKAAKSRRSSGGVEKSSRKSSGGEEKPSRKPSNKPAVKPKPRRNNIDLYTSDAKRPMSIRDHKANAAYLVCKIVEDLAKFSGRPTHPLPPPPPMITAPAKAKKSRKSAPADLGRAMKSNIVRAPARPRKVTWKPPPVAVDAKLPQTEGATAPEGSFDLITTPKSQESAADASILAAVKSNPRKRKRKTIDGEEVSLPVVGTKKQAVGKSKPKPRPVELSQTCTPTPTFTRRLYTVKLPPLVPPKAPSFQDLPIPFIAPLASSAPSAWSSSALVRPTPLEPEPTMGPAESFSPTLSPTTPRRARFGGMDNPFFYADPLVGRLVYPPVWGRARELGAAGAEASPSRQLRREQDERALVAMVLSGLAGGGEKRDG